MYSTRKIFACLVIFNLSGFLFFQSNSVLGNIIRSGIRAVIEKVSTLLGPFKLLTIITPLEETCLVNLTKHSLDVHILTPTTVSTLAAPILGNDIYQFHKFSLFFQTTSCNTTRLESRVYHFNLKYSSYEQALNYPDGIVISTFPVETSGDFANPVFFGFSELFENKIKQPGDHSVIHSSFTYRWYVNFSYGSVYTFYKANFVDEDFGKKYTAIVLNLPMDPRINFVSKQQFASTFGKLTGMSTKSMANGFIQDSAVNAITPVERHQGVCVLNLPA